MSGQHLSGQSLSERELSGQALEEREFAEDERDEEALGDEEDEAADRGMPAALRVLGIVVVFLFLGPPIGGYSLLVIAFVLKALVHGIDWGRLSHAFIGAIFFTAIFSYVFGGVVALLTGIMVSASRVVGGSTSILTPIFAALVANGAAVLLNAIIATKSLTPSLPDEVPLTAGLLPASIFSAILCWQLTKRWKLA